MFMSNYIHQNQYQQADTVWEITTNTFYILHIKAYYNQRYLQYLIDQSA